MPRERVSFAEAAATRAMSDGSHVAARPIACGNAVAPALREAVQRLFERDDRDAEPRLLDEVPLDGVDALGVAAGDVGQRAARTGSHRRPAARGASEICRPKMPRE